MIVEKEFRRLVHQLIHQEVAQIVLGNSEVNVHVFDDDTKVSLSTTVYFGDNFIPKSVRDSLTKKPAFLNGAHINTYFTLDEDAFRVDLNFIGGLAHLNKRMFVDLIEEFSALADEWRLFLDEHDKNDLIHIYKLK